MASGNVSSIFKAVEEKMIQRACNDKNNRCSFSTLKVFPWNFAVLHGRVGEKHEQAF